MKWRKLGQIFSFSCSPFAKRFVSHAQSPQALVLDDRIRVYFSTRTVDKPGRFLSHVQYVDFDPELKNIIDFSRNEVLPLGRLGTFDEHGIFPLSPMKFRDKIYGFTNGISRRVSVAVETGVGLAISSDNGKSFQRFGDGPILSSTVNEPFLVGDPFVRIFNSKFHMFYLFGRKWCNETDEHPSERVYKIGHAISTDGINWIKSNRSIIPDKLDENECQALPTVIQINQRYHMCFCYRAMIGFRSETKHSYRLGYAYSDDLENWIRDDEKLGIDLSTDGWDSQMMCYPNLFEQKDSIYLLYNGNFFGRDGFGLAVLTSV